MASSVSYIEFLCEQISEIGEVRYKKMFGEYMVYLNSKPILLVCNDTVFVKIKDETTKLLSNAEIGTPYKGAKEHYILDIENRELSQKLAKVLERTTSLPKSRKNNKKIDRK